MTDDMALRRAATQALANWKAVYPEAALRLGNSRYFTPLAAAMDDLKAALRKHERNES